ncbi:hypothetical protein HanRHA438_Chr02g0061031 [Helianthus annuus]|nr:hypothetical protein HanIR_Chr02g0067021 [Helianthus annuus]KAJ0939429.1 hypothetical protein HanRHA438_Chr02g0061031 [Helianthus annuus]KAJ0951304.1 hypothetical protein HanPSC8_Chr02g0058421 [Helianthus annuus]
MIEIARDIFDVDHIISSLRGDVRILKELPPSLLLIFGFQKTILLDKYTIGILSWDEFSGTVKDTHAQGRGAIQRRLVMLNRPNQKMTFIQIQKSIRMMNL